MLFCSSWVHLFMHKLWFCVSEAPPALLATWMLLQIWYILLGYLQRWPDLGAQPWCPWRESTPETLLVAPLGEDFHHPGVPIEGLGKKIIVSLTHEQRELLCDYYILGLNSIVPHSSIWYAYSEVFWQCCFLTHLVFLYFGIFKRNYFNH